MALERHGGEERAGAQGQRIVQRQFAKLMYSASSRDGAQRARKRERGRGNCGGVLRMRTTDSEEVLFSTHTPSTVTLRRMRQGLASAL